MENALPVESQSDISAPQKDLRRHDRTPVNLRIVVADKSGLAEGQVLDLSPHGCRLRLKKRLLRGQYLWLKIYPEDGRTTPICDLVRVRWIVDDLVGVEFLCVALESLFRIHKLFGDQILCALEDYLTTRIHCHAKRRLFTCLIASHPTPT